MRAAAAAAGGQNRTKTLSLPLVGAALITLLIKHVKEKYISSI